MDESNSHLSSLLAECKEVSNIYRKMQVQNNHRLSKIALFISKIDDFRSVCESGCKWILKESTSRRTEIETSVSSNSGKVFDLNTTLGRIEAEATVILQSRMKWIQRFVCRVEATHERLENIYSEISDLALEEMENESTKLSAFYKDFYVQKSKYLKLMPAQLSEPSSSSTTNGRRVTRSHSSSDSGMLWRDRNTSHTSFDNTSNEDGMTTMDMDLVSPQQAKSKGCFDNGGLRNHRGINVADNCNRGDFPEESQRGHSEPITLLNDSDSDSDSDSKVACVALDHSATRTNIAERNRLQLAAESSIRVDNNAENFNQSVAQPILSQTVSVVEIMRNLPKSTDVLNTSTECKAEHILVPEIVKDSMRINTCGESNGNASNVIPDKSDTSSSQNHDLSGDPVTTSTTSATVATIAGIIDDELSGAHSDPIPLNKDHITVKPISVVGLVPIRKSPLSSITSTSSTSNEDIIPPLKSQRPVCRIPLKTVLPCSSSSSRCSISNTDVSATEGLPCSNPSSQESVSLSSSVCSTSNGGSNGIQRDTTTVCYGKDRTNTVRTAGDSLLTTSVAQTSKSSLKRTHTESGLSIDATGSNRNHRLPAQGQNKRSNKVDLTDDS